MPKFEEIDIGGQQFIARMFSFRYISDTLEVRCVVE